MKQHREKGFATPPLPLCSTTALPPPRSLLPAPCSDTERKMMERLESDPHVLKWMKRHGITIPWIDGQKHQRRYCPDFLVEYEDGRKAIIEVKDPSRLDSNDLQRKRKAAEIWCKQRGMEYVVATIDRA